MPLVKMSEINQQKTSTPSGLVPMGSISSSPQADVPSTQSAPVNFTNLMDSPLMKQANQPESNPQPDNGDMRTDYPGGYWNPLNDLGYLANSPVIRSFDNAAGKAMGVPDNMMNSAKPTGSKFLDTALSIAGQGAGYLTNPSQIEQNLGNDFFNNNIVNSASNKVGGFVNDGLAKLTGSNVSSTIVGRFLRDAAEGATTGALGSAMYAPFQTLNSGGDVQGIPQAILEQGLTGGVFGGALGGLGSLAKSGLKSMNEIRGGSKETTLPDYTNQGIDNIVTDVPSTLKGSLRGLGDVGTIMKRKVPSEPAILETSTPIASKDVIPRTDMEQFRDPNTGELNTKAYLNEWHDMEDAYKKQSIFTVEPKPLPAMTDNYLKPLSNYSDTLYRETNPEQAVELLPGSNVLTDLTRKELYFSNKRDMALGQGNNKGVMIEFSPGNLQGQVNTSKPMWEQAYKSGEAEFKAKLNEQKSYQDAVKSVTIQKDAEMGRVTKAQFQRLLSNWDSIKNEDGSITYRRPNYQPKSEQIQPTRKLSGTISGLGDSVNISKSNSIKSMKEIQGNVLNSDAKPLEPIKLTPNEIARNERIDQFSKVESNPNIPNTADQIQSKTGRQSVPFLTRANESYIKGVDNLHRINQFDQVAKDANGGELKPSDSAYTLALNARGHDMQASQIANRNLINSKGEVVDLPLAAVTNQIPKGKETAFNDYTVAKHAIDRMGRGETVYADNKGMTIQKAQAIVDRYDKTDPTFKEIAKQYTDFSHNFAQNWYVDTGLMKQSQLDGYREANPNYVPNKRIFSDLEKKNQFGGSKNGIVGQTLPVKKAPGSQRQIVNPIESSLEDIQKGVKTAKTNEAGQAIVRSLRRNPEDLKGFAEIVQDHPKLDVNKLIQEEGPQGLIDHINKTFEDATNKPDLEKGNVVTVLENGEPVNIRVFDPQMLEAVSNLSPKGQDYVTEFVGKGTKVMKTLTTGVNPVFGLTRNIFRDIPHAFISSKSTNNPLRFGVDLVDSMTSVLADAASQSKIAPDFMKGWLETRGKLYNDYKNMGGGHSSSIAADRNLLAQSKEKLIPSNGVGQTLKRNLLTRPYHILENLNNAAEATPRLGEFKRLSKGGGYDNKVKALYEANDLTVNFNKFGNVTKNVDAYLPYLNAAVQGLDQIARMSLAGGAKRLTQVYAKALGTLTIPTAILYLINHNDPNYQQTSNFIKDNNLLIPNGDGTFTKIAKPRELGMAFSTGVERILRAFNEHDPKAFQDFGHNFLQNFLPPGIAGGVDGLEKNGLTGLPTGILGDTIAGPIQSLASNKDFAGRPIVPQDLLGVSPKLQYDSRTSEPAKLLGNMFNTSPKQLDYLAKSYGGVIGQLGIPLATKGGSIGDTLKQQVTADPTFSNDISRNFYDQKAKADMAKADAKLTGNAPEDTSSKYYDTMAARFAKIRKQQKLIQNDDYLSKPAKQQQIKELQQMLNELQSSATK